uniref:Uncharacterized protein n=1 Tax=Arundo donax TaxID=35708 RepID=A0A0A9BE59_ARUDO
MPRSSATSPPIQKFEAQIHCEEKLRISNKVHIKRMTD